MQRGGENEKEMLSRVEWHSAIHSWKTTKVGKHVKRICPTMVIVFVKDLPKPRNQAVLSFLLNVGYCSNYMIHHIGKK